MALLISLIRETQRECDLGEHDAVELTFDELCSVADGKKLATHRHNRWVPVEDPRSHAKLHIDGPLTISGPNSVLGPYLNFETFDGVGYVDGRVFAFTDVQVQDWYVHDVGKHWPRLRIAFHSTGP